MWLLAVLALALAGAYFFIARDASRSNAGARRGLRSGGGALVRIAVPSGRACCEAASELATHRFEPHLAPKLPLADCTMGTNCRCRHESVSERRVAVRRLNRDRLPRSAPRIRLTARPALSASDHCGPRSSHSRDSREAGSRPADFRGASDAA